MYPCCTYDPGFLLLTLDEEGFDPAPEPDALTVASAIMAAIWIASLLLLVS